MILGLASVALFYVAFMSYLHRVLTAKSTGVSNEEPAIPQAKAKQQSAG